MQLQRFAAGTAEALEMIRELQAGARCSNEQARREAVADAAQRRGQDVPASGAPLGEGDLVTCPAGTGRVRVLVRKFDTPGAEVRFPDREAPHWMPLSALRRVAG